MTVVCVHPKHEFFYRGIKFEKLGGLKTYASVQKNPALAFYWDAKELEGTATGPLQSFFGFGTPKDSPPHQARPKRLNTRDFGEMFLSSKI